MMMAAVIRIATDLMELEVVVGDAWRQLNRRALRLAVESIYIYI
jgi:hypothetical protein